MIGPWSLPGPARLVGNALASLNRSRVVVLHPARNAGGLLDALQDRLLQQAFRVLLFDGGQPGSFRAWLAEQVMAPNTPSVAALATEPQLQGAVLLIRAREPPDADLRLFVRLIQRTGSDGPALLAVTDDGTWCLPGVQTQQVRNAVRPLDAAAYAAWLPWNDDPLVGHLVASVAMEIAAWDLALLDTLAVLKPGQAVRPDLHVPAWDGGWARTWKDAALRWEDGCLDGWSGQDTPHPAWLAANRPDLLVKRVWRGQIAALLPWVEQHRMAVVARCRRTLRPSNAGDDVELLDWGPLCAQLRGFDAALSKPAEAFRLVRNQLAHGRPVMWAEVATCLQNSARLLGPASG